MRAARPPRLLSPDLPDGTLSTDLGPTAGFGAEAIMAKNGADLIPLSVYGIDRLPDAPYPVDLTDIPLVRSTKTLPPPGPDGILPLEAYHTEYTITLMDGTRLSIEITGHPKLGAPYGELDHKVLVAIFTLLDRNGWYDGVFRDPSVGMFLSTLGLADTGRTHEAIRAALTRIANLKINIKAITRSEQLTLALVSDEDEKLVLPPIEEITNTGKDTTWVIDYAETVRHIKVRPQDPTNPRWKTDSAGRTYQVEHRIDRLTVNPLIVRQALRGWVAWIDTEKFASLRSPYAMRLYLLLAGRAAKESTLPPEWRYPLGQIRQILGIPEKTKPSHVVSYITAAAGQLQALGVLGELDTYRTSGSYTVIFRPGAELRLTSWLLGVRPTDLEDTRIILAVLARFGFKPEEARALLSEAPDSTKHLVQYAVYLEQVQPGFIRSTYYGWIKENIRKRRDYSRDTRFQRWLANGGRLTEPKTAEQAPIPFVFSMPRITPSSAEAADLWLRICARMAERNPTFEASWGRQVVGDRIDEASAALVCLTANSMAVDWVPKHFPEIHDWLAEITDGRLRRVVIEVVQRTS